MKRFAMYLIIFFFFQVPLLAKDTIDLKKETVSKYLKLSRDVEITMNSMVKFRCKLMYIDSKFCIVNYHTAVKPKNIVKGPEIADNLDTSLGKNMYIIPISQIKIIAVWRLRSSYVAELPLGLFSYTLPLAGIVGLANGYTPPVISIVAASAVGLGIGIGLNRRIKYYIGNGKMIRIRKA